MDRSIDDQFSEFNYPDQRREYGDLIQQISGSSMQALTASGANRQRPTIRLSDTLDASSSLQQKPSGFVDHTPDYGQRGTTKYGGMEQLNASRDLREDWLYEMESEEPYEELQAEDEFEKHTGRSLVFRDYDPQLAHVADATLLSGVSLVPRVSTYLQSARQAAGMMALAKSSQFYGTSESYSSSFSNPNSSVRNRQAFSTSFCIRDATTAGSASDVSESGPRLEDSRCAARDLASDDTTQASSGNIEQDFSRSWPVEAPGDRKPQDVSLSSMEMTYIARDSNDSRDTVASFGTKTSRRKRSIDGEAAASINLAALDRDISDKIFGEPLENACTHGESYVSQSDVGSRNNSRFRTTANQSDTAEPSSGITPSKISPPRPPNNQGIEVAAAGSDLPPCISSDAHIASAEGTFSNDELASILLLLRSGRLSEEAAVKMLGVGTSASLLRELDKGHLEQLKSRGLPVDPVTLLEQDVVPSIHPKAQEPHPQLLGATRPSQKTEELEKKVPARLITRSYLSAESVPNAAEAQTTSNSTTVTGPSIAVDALATMYRSLSSQKHRKTRASASGHGISEGVNLSTKVNPEIANILVQLCLDGTISGRDAQNILSAMSNKLNVVAKDSVPKTVEPDLPLSRESTHHAHSPNIINDQYGRDKSSPPEESIDALLSALDSKLLGEIPQQSSVATEAISKVTNEAERADSSPMRETTVASSRKAGRSDTRSSSGHTEEEEESYHPVHSTKRERKIPSEVAVCIHHEDGKSTVWRPKLKPPSNNQSPTEDMHSESPHRSSSKSKREATTMDQRQYRKRQSPDQHHRSKAGSRAGSRDRSEKARSRSPVQYSSSRRNRSGRSRDRSSTRNRRDGKNAGRLRSSPPRERGRNGDGRTGGKTSTSKRSSALVTPRNMTASDEVEDSIEKSRNEALLVDRFDVNSLKFTVSDDVAPICFEGDSSFLSNLYRDPKDSAFIIDSRRFRSGALSYFYWHKMDFLGHKQEAILCKNASSPADVLALKNGVKKSANAATGSKYREYRDYRAASVMLKALKAKFVPGADLSQRLLSTGDALVILAYKNIEWGANMTLSELGNYMSSSGQKPSELVQDFKPGGSGNIGKNLLGLLLMDVRESLRLEHVALPTTIVVTPEVLDLSEGTNNFQYYGPAIPPDSSDVGHHTKHQGEIDSKPPVSETADVAAGGSYSTAAEAIEQSSFLTDLFNPPGPPSPRRQEIGRAAPASHGGDDCVIELCDKIQVYQSFADSVSDRPSGMGSKRKAVDNSGDASTTSNLKMGKRDELGKRIVAGFTPAVSEYDAGRNQVGSDQKGSVSCFGEIRLETSFSGFVCVNSAKCPLSNEYGTGGMDGTIVDGRDRYNSAWTMYCCRMFTELCFDQVAAELQAIPTPQKAMEFVVRALSRKGRFVDLIPSNITEMTDKWYSSRGQAVLASILEKKFSQHALARWCLISTESSFIVNAQESNKFFSIGMDAVSFRDLVNQREWTPQDVAHFCATGEHGMGKNIFGFLLSKLRDRLRNNRDMPPIPPVLAEQFPSIHHDCSCRKIFDSSESKDRPMNTSPQDQKTEDKVIEKKELALSMEEAKGPLLDLEEEEMEREAEVLLLELGGVSNCVSEENADLTIDMEELRSLEANDARKDGESIAPGPLAMDICSDEETLAVKGNDDMQLELEGERIILELSVESTSNVVVAPDIRINDFNTDVVQRSRVDIVVSGDNVTGVMNSIDGVDEMESDAEKLLNELHEPQNHVAKANITGFRGNCAVPVEDDYLCDDVEVVHCTLSTRAGLKQNDGSFTEVIGAQTDAPLFGAPGGAILGSVKSDAENQPCSDDLARRQNIVEPELSHVADTRMKSIQDLRQRVKEILAASATCTASNGSNSVNMHRSIPPGPVPESVPSESVVPEAFPSAVSQTVVSSLEVNVNVSSCSKLGDIEDDDMIESVSVDTKNDKDGDSVWSPYVPTFNVPRLLLFAQKGYTGIHTFSSIRSPLTFNYCDPGKPDIQVDGEIYRNIWAYYYYVMFTELGMALDVTHEVRTSSSILSIFNIAEKQRAGANKDSVTKWEKRRGCQVMYVGLRAKFLLDSIACRALLATGESFLVFTAVKDKVWSIGMLRSSLSNYIALKRIQTTDQLVSQCNSVSSTAKDIGANRLGFLLCKLRLELRSLVPPLSDLVDAERATHVEEQASTGSPGFTPFSFPTEAERAKLCTTGSSDATPHSTGPPSIESVNPSEALSQLGMDVAEQPNQEIQATEKCSPEPPYASTSGSGSPPRSAGFASIPTSMSCSDSTDKIALVDAFPAGSAEISVLSEHLCGRSLSKRPFVVDGHPHYSLLHLVYGQMFKAFGMQSLIDSFIHRPQPAKVLFSNLRDVFKSAMPGGFISRQLLAKMNEWLLGEGLALLLSTILESSCADKVRMELVSTGMNYLVDVSLDNCLWGVSPNQFTTTNHSTAEAIDEDVLEAKPISGIGCNLMGRLMMMARRELRTLLRYNPSRVGSQGERKSGRSTRWSPSDKEGELTVDCLSTSSSGTAAPGTSAWNCTFWPGDSYNFVGVKCFALEDVNHIKQPKWLDDQLKPWRSAYHWFYALMLRKFGLARHVERLVLKKTLRPYVLVNNMLALLGGHDTSEGGYVSSKLAASMAEWHRVEGLRFMRQFVWENCRRGDADAWAWLASTEGLLLVDCRMANDFWCNGVSRARFAQVIHENNYSADDLMNIFQCRQDNVEKCKRGKNWMGLILTDVRLEMEQERRKGNALGGDRTGQNFYGLELRRMISAGAKKKIQEAATDWVFADGTRHCAVKTDVDLNALSGLNVWRDSSANVVQRSTTAGIISAASDVSCLLENMDRSTGKSGVVAMRPLMTRSDGRVMQQSYRNPIFLGSLMENNYFNG